MRAAAIAALLALAALLAKPAVALDPERTITQYKHAQWTASDGAPPIIYALAQGADGYIWVGSASGLYRFDGVGFEHIAPSEAAANAWRATALLAARDGTIWVGYHGGGIATYRDGVLRTDRSAPATNAYVLDLKQTRDGTIWATVFRPDRWILRRGTDGRWEEIGPDWGLPVSDEFSTMLLPAQDGSLWVVTDGAVFRLAEGGRRFTRVGRVDATVINQDPSGRIWLSGPWGSRVFSGSAGDPGDAAFPTPAFSGWPAITRFDRDGNLWGLNGNGLFRMRAPGETRVLSAGERAVRVERFTARDGLTADTASAFLEDREGNIWIGSTLGLDQFRPANVVIEPQLVEMPTFGAGLAAVSDGSIYVGTRDSVYRIAPGGRPELAARAPDEADHICEAADGTIWALTRGPPLRIRQGEAARVPAPILSTIRRSSANGPAGCAADDRGVLWLVGTQSGMFSNAAGQWRRHPPAADDWVEAMTLDRQRRPLVWLHSGALARLDAGGRPGQILLRRTQSDVNFLYQGRRDLLLGGVFGLSRLREGALQIVDPARFPWLADPHGLVETPDGQTWLIGRAGIVGVATADLERAFADPRARLDPIILGFEDGLPNVRGLTSQNGVVRGGDGRLWFATVGGIVWVDPARLHRNRVPPPVHVRALVANGLRHRDPARVTLDRATSSVAIQYTGLSFTVPQRVRFRYRLEGVDEEWVDAGSRREAFYTNLGAGTYRFQVVAANNDGVWNEEGTTLEFTIPPTFLQSIWFKLLCALALGALFWVAHVLRVRRLEARLQGRFEVRIAERERIARELHDTLLQSFQGLTLLFQSVADRVPPGSDLREPIERGLDHADAALAEGRDRVHELRGETASRDLAQSLRDAVADILPGETPGFGLSVEGTPRPLQALVGEEVLRIAQEAVRNVLRHADARTIEAVLTYGKGELRLLVRDDGVGLPAQVLAGQEPAGHYGLVGMRERAEQIGGRLDLATRAEGGAEVILSVPARAAYLARRRRWFARRGNP